VTGITHVFVEEIPEDLEPNKLYVSIAYKTAVHKCCCGCGHEVVTPISPTDWELRFNGAAVSLSPSIGNWSFPCKSHYWIDKGRVDWAAKMSDGQIRAVRDLDRRTKDQFYGECQAGDAVEKVPRPNPTPPPASDGGLLAKLKSWCFRT
jgi:hypothetical protein